MKRLALLCCAVIALCCAGFAQTGNSPRQNPPSVSFDEDKTPLQKKLDKQIADRVGDEKKVNPNCAKAVDEPDPDPEVQAKNLAKFCKVPRVNQKSKKTSDLLVHGKKVGRKIETETELIFDSPEQQGAADHWADLKVARQVADDIAAAPAGENPSTVRVRRAILPTSAAINNDRDCIDTLTQKYIGGYRMENGVRTLIPDGDPESCFQNTSPPVLKETLTLVPDGSGSCRHADGTVFAPEQCVEMKYTTLEELIDEDGPSKDGQSVDQDLDGNVEDVPDAPSGESECVKNGGTADISGGCDFAQGMRRRINDKLKEKKDKGELPPERQKDFKQGFKLDAAGNCDPLAEGEVECGKEPRTITLNETMELSCPKGSEYKEIVIEGKPTSSRCEKSDSTPPAPGLALAERESGALAPALMAAGLATTAATTSASDYAMMGFTFAPPVLKWGVDIKQNVCIFFCFEIFSFRFGYEFDLATGLRLPVKVTVADIPTPNAVAEQTASLHTTMEPVDFTVGDYKQFCTKHNLARDWWISDCDRFAFPDYFESLIPTSVLAEDSRQGSEFVAQTSIFAGLKIAVFTIPVVNYAIDSSMNLPALCTFYKMKGSGLSGPLDFAENLISSRNFMESLRSSLTNCGTFTTPFGYEPDPIGGVPKLRSFPFLSGTYTIGADCTKALLDGNLIEIGGKKKPICTGMKLDIYGATLGMAINLTLAAGSDLIDAKATVSGDGSGAVDQPVAFHHAIQETQDPTIGPLTFDNYKTDTDNASIAFDDFVYHLNQLQVRVSASLEFGGIASFLPNVGDLTIFALNLDTGSGIPIPQHPGTGPAKVEVPVANYALTVDAKPRPTDPKRVSDDILRVMPGTSGVFEVWVKNEGTVPDTMDNLTSALSNRPQNTGPFSFGISLNPDFDCIDASGKSYWGYPFDGIADDCYDAAGNVLPGRTEVTVDDSLDVWHSALGATSVASVPAHTVAATPVTLTVTPYRHPLTRPGDYPVRITADSRGARELHLGDTDPSSLPRKGAEKVVFMKIESFFEPDLRLTPADVAVKPRGAVTYTVETVNGGNDSDRFAVQSTFPDSDKAGCTLTTNGGAPECPYRALITGIDAVGWTTVAGLDAVFPATGSLQPLRSAQQTFRLTVPENWAGMQDTTYEFTLTATSTADTAIPPAAKQKTARFKVLATKESMIRYVNLEVAEFMEQINQAAAQGISARGIQPVMLHPITMMTTRALEEVSAGDLGSASKTLASATKIMEAVNRMVNGATIPEPLGSDWKARSAALLADLTQAQASNVSAAQ